MARDAGGGGDGTSLRGRLHRSRWEVDDLRTRPSGPVLGRALALLLVLAGAAALVHPAIRAVLGGAPGALSVVVGVTLLFVLVDPLGVLRRVENRVLASLLETLFPTTADAGDAPADVVAELQSLLPTLPWLDRLALRATAWLLLVSPVLAVGSPRPFPLLDRDDREAVTRAWGTSRFVPLRALFTLVKGTLAMVHFEREAVLDEVGWTPSDSGYGEG